MADETTPFEEKTEDVDEEIKEPESDGGIAGEITPDGDV
jgi:hypothetical protein